MFLCVPLNESVFNIVEGALQIARLCTACWKKHTLPYLAATTIHFTAILRPIEYYLDKIAGIYGALWLSNASIEQTTAIYTGIFCIFLNTQNLPTANSSVFSIQGRPKMQVKYR